MQNTIDAAKFGPLGQPMKDAVQACVHCGFCLAACPTYQELGQEMDSPRGRIVLMKSVLEGSIDSEDASSHIDQCLGCLACEPACPSGVSYRDLISPYRAITTDDAEKPFATKFKRLVVENTLPFPNRFRIAAKLGQASKSLSPFLPAAVKPMLSLLPTNLPPAKSFPGVVPAIGPKRGRVALLVGCAQQVLDPDINQATIEVLTLNGIEVVIPQEQGCCGALSWHVGNLKKAQEFASRNLEAFPGDIDAIITNAAGCGSGINEYDLILKGTDEEEQAKAFRNKTIDISAYLAQLGSLKPIPKPSSSLKIAYHDACHLANAQGVRSEPRTLLARIPGATILEIPDGHLCCGSAGTYNIDQPEIAALLGKQKAQNALKVKPDLVAMGNIGCQTQIQLYINELTPSVPVRHTIQIMRDAYQGALE